MKIILRDKKKKRLKELRKKQELEKKQKQEYENNKDLDISGKKRTEIKSENKFYYEAEPFTSQYNLSKKTIKKELKLRKKNPENIVLIRMEMSNGMFREFLIIERFGCFSYKKNLYVLDNSMKYYLIDRDIWAYDFHEFLSLPLRKHLSLSDKLESLIQPELDKLEKHLQDDIDKAKKRPLKPHFNTDEIKTVIENADIVDVEASINPTTLKRFTDSEVIKQVLQGAMLGRIFKIMFVLVIIIAIFMFILILIQLYTSGIFDKVGQMFHK